MKGPLHMSGVGFDVFEILMCMWCCEVLKGYPFQDSTHISQIFCKHILYVPYTVKEIQEGVHGLDQQVNENK